jgi:heme oxygenase
MHGRIDQASVLTLLTVPGVTLDLYRTAMQSLKLAYEEIDRLLVDHCGLCPADVPSYTPRGPRIHSDLIALNAGPLNPSGAWTGRGLRGLKTEAAYLGMRYVVEGAQLGSRVIYGHLRMTFGEKLDGFGSFWAPDPARESSWPGVLRSLAQVKSRNSLAAAALTARVTFRHMEHYLTAVERGTL